MAWLKPDISVQGEHIIVVKEVRDGSSVTINTLDEDALNRLLQHFGSHFNELREQLRQQQNQPAITRLLAQIDLAPNPRLLATFVGRESELAQLETALQGDMPVAVTAMVEGMAGVGKSWLVDYFHSQHSARYPHYYKLSLDPRQPGTAQEHLAMLAEQLQVKVAQLPAALAQGGLLHLENADSPAAAQVAGSIAKALPRCKLVVSGRLRGVGRNEKWARVSVASFDLADSMTQLQRELAFLDAPPLAQDDARQLAQALGGLPLALHLAAGYLAKNPDITAFLEKLHRYQLDLPPDDPSESQERTILRASFHLSLEFFASQCPPNRAEKWKKALFAFAIAPAEGVGLKLGAALADVDNRLVAPIKQEKSMSYKKCFGLMTMKNQWLS